MSTETYSVDVFRDGYCVETYTSSLDLDDPKQKVQEELLTAAVGQHGRSPADREEFARFELRFRNGWGRAGSYRGPK